MSSAVPRGVPVARSRAGAAFRRPSFLPSAPVPPKPPQGRSPLLDFQKGGFPSRARSVADSGWRTASCLSTGRGFGSSSSSSPSSNNSHTNNNNSSSSSSTGDRRACAVTSELRQLLTSPLPLGQRRCLWLLGEVADASPARMAIDAVLTEFSEQRLLDGTCSRTAAEVAIIDLGKVRHRNFEVVLESIVRGLMQATVEAATNVISGVAPESFESPADVAEALRTLLLLPVLEAEPDLAAELVVFAEALAARAQEGSDGESAAAAAAGLEAHASNAGRLWAHLALHLATDGPVAISSDGVAAADAVVGGALGVLQSVAAHAEQRESPPGYETRPTGLHLLPYLLSAMEASATAAQVPAVVVFLHVEVLARSLFVDVRGEELLGLLMKRLHPTEHVSSMPGEPVHSSMEPQIRASGLRSVLQTNDASTAYWALSPPLSG
ncbi:unnamed protein product, partial [Polarella glacialis]